MASINDERLMESVKAGNLEAFDALLRRHGKALLNYVYRCVGSMEDAEDLVQETFLRVLQYAPSFNSHQKFTTWAYHIATNLCIDSWRKSQRRSAASLDQSLEEGDEALMDSVPDPQADTASIVERRELQRHIRRAVSLLPPEQRAVVVLCQYQGLSYQEIAETLGCPIGTVKSRMHNAMKALREALREWL